MDVQVVRHCNVDTSSPTVVRHNVASAARWEWSAIGVLGRLAFSGVLISLGIAVALGIWIPHIVRQHLLQARVDLIATIGDEIASQDLVPVGAPGSDTYRSLGEEIELSLLGGETVRVKLWTVDGTVAYSDDVRLVGQTFDLTPTALAALAGTPSYGISDLSEPAHAYEQNMGQVLELFVPVHDQNGVAIGLFEVEQRVDALDATLGQVRRNVWLAIGSGVGLLAVFMTSLALSSARVLDRRRRQAELLLGSLIRAQEEERRRIVGALHDDIGQPVFRLLYGLEGSRSKLSEGHVLEPEIDRLVDITRDIDRTLRSELRTLHQGIDLDLGLALSIEAIVETTRAETDLAIDLDLEDVDPSTVTRDAKTALVYAAREGITNVRKHATASHLAVALTQTAQQIVVSIEDDGSGIRSVEGLGLATTRDRLEAIGGSLRIRSTRGHGTLFRASIPITGGER
jgi:signal transduction histidine kinase